MPYTTAKELQALQQAMQCFKRFYPKQAQALKLDTLQADPTVERLLEGIAYLTGQIEQKIQDDIPEITGYLLAHLFPHSLKPLPSYTLLQFTPRPDQLRHSYTLAKGSIAYSNPLGPEQTICRFTTTSALIINPIQIKACTIVNMSEGRYRLSINITSDAGIYLPELDLNCLSFYLQGNQAKALFLAIAQHKHSLQITFPEYQNALPSHLPLSCLTHNTYPKERALLPLYEQSPYSLQALLEGLNYPEKSLFFFLSGLKDLPWPKPICRCLRIEIILQDLPIALSSIDTTNIQLHCVPAINLYPLQSEPISITQTQVEYPIIADNVRPESVKIYHVNEVTGLDPKNAKRSAYIPFYQFKHINNHAEHYHIQQRDEQHYLTINNHEKIEYISCELQVYNGNYPYLNAAQIRIPEQQIPSEISVDNLTRPSEIRLIPRHTCLYWQILSHLAFNYQAFDSLSHWQHLLACYDWSRDKDSSNFIQALEDYSLTVTHKIKKGAFVQCLELRFTVQECAFANIAELYQFTYHLYAFFKLYCALNYSLQMRILCLPSKREYQWPSDYED